MVKIKVCRSCGWSNAKLRRELGRLQRKHEGAVCVVTKGCMDRCKKEPVVRVAKTILAPARPKKLRRLIEKALEG